MKSAMTKQVDASESTIDDVSQALRELHRSMQVSSLVFANMLKSNRIADSRFAKKKQECTKGDENDGTGE